MDYQTMLIVAENHLVNTRRYQHLNSRFAELRYTPYVSNNVDTSRAGIIPEANRHTHISYVSSVKVFSWLMVIQRRMSRSSSVPFFPPLSSKTPIIYFLRGIMIPHTLPMRFLASFLSVRVKAGSQSMASLIGTFVECCSTSYVSFTVGFMSNNSRWVAKKDPGTNHLFGLTSDKKAN
ncbi:hypothetical protein CEXT_373661 [Caerostris extrusa]|uniref:Uncharacterized protein n=1 Tax=Caerostris extrusa TaxID=172846 RepID=A0AAV4N9B0_CAEEX|nr:hypothetical protein CEXT_373661 [Caerostris extrusa]